MSSYFMTSESVTEGHPDKICDQISDAVLDAILSADPTARVACETAVKTGLVFVFGEVRTSTYIDIDAIVRGVVKNIGYTDAAFGFDFATCGVINAIGNQSPEIAQGVDEADEKSMGAGDQGMMFGYAIDTTEDYMPLAISLAHRLAKKLSDVRKDGTLGYLRPDGKTQVTVEYDRETRKPLRVDTVVVSTQHSEDVTQEQIRTELLAEVIKPIVGDLFDDQTKVFVNPTGAFTIGGPLGDAGLTGRKIIVDTYGGYAPHGGGAFSGKDPSKVDRSAAYMARYIAKHIVASGLARECQVQLAYAIGVSEPVSIWVNTFGSGKHSDMDLERMVRDVFDCSPAGIIRTLDLLRPIYARTACYGHFGAHCADLPWEQLDKLEEVKGYGFS